LEIPATTIVVIISVATYYRCANDVNIATVVGIIVVIVVQQRYL